jgi:hypothetical protein
MSTNGNSLTNQNTITLDDARALFFASASKTPESYADVSNEFMPAPMSAADYIRTLFAPDDLICIMTLRKGEKPKHLFVTVEEETSPEFMDSLRKQNEAGCDIYVCMNPLTAKRRVKENVAVTRTVYLDIDRDSAAALKRITESALVPKPHAILQSSPGKFQVIWSVDGIQPAEQERLLAALIQKFGGDPAASDCTRVLRLPGFKNHKYPEKPIVEVIESNFDGQEYTAADFKVKVAPFKLAEKTPAVIEAGERNDRLASLAGKLRREGFNDDEILASLQIANRRCPSPLPDSEVAAIVTSIMRYAPAKTVEGSEVESVSIATVGTKDMPESVLDGWLGQICKSRMLEHFPVAYAWPALVTVASAMVPTNSATNGTRCNLYTALVGPIHSGKSEAIKHAKLLLGIQSPPLLDLLAGSAEMLTSAVAEAAGQPRLYSPDELGHLLEKAQIQNSSFVYVLNRAFYETGFKVRSMEKKRKEVSFNAILSVVGGIVEDRFSDLYAAKSTGGFYDRGLYSLGPTGFRYEYMPFEGGPALQIHRTGDDDLDAEEMFAPVGNRPIPVRLDKSVFAETNRWRREDAILKNPDCNRVVEIALRVATICASFDRRPILYGKDLGPAFELARYQARVRGVLKPNPGRTYEGQLYHKFFECLTTHTSDGSWMARKDLFHRTRAYEVGLPVATKTLDAMIANDDVEGLNQTPPHGGRVKKLVRIRKLAVQL